MARGRLVSLLPFLLLAWATLPPVTSAGEEVPEDIARALSAVLKERADELLGAKNEDGTSYVRGTFSDNFKKVDDSTWTTTFFKDTATANRLVSERSKVTLKRDASGKWSVTDETAEGTFDRLERGELGKDRFERFASFSFDREGMKITATNGELIVSLDQGKPDALIFASSDLAYEYRLPRDLGYYGAKRKVLYDRHPEDFVFKPEFVQIRCDETTCNELLEKAFTGRTEIGLGESFASQLSNGSLRKTYTDSLQEARKTLRENAFAYYQVPDPPEYRHWNVAIKRSGGKEHYVQLDYDMWEPWDVRFGAWGYGPLFGYYSEQVLGQGKSPADLERREDPDARLYEVDGLSGRVDVALEDAERLFADVTFTLTVKHAQRDYPFYVNRLLQRGNDSSQKNPRMTLHSIRDGEGNDLSWVRTGPVSGRVVLPDAPKVGSKLTLRVRFTSLDSIIKLTPSYSYVDRSGWLPFVRLNDMIDSFDLRVRAPSRYTVVSVGTKEGEKRDGSVTETHWVAHSPVSFPTVIFGDYITAEPSFKATKKDGTEIPVRVYLDRDSTSQWDIRPKQLQAIADQAANALNLYREVFGIDYPFGKLDLVNDPATLPLYGQSPASIVYLGSLVFRGEGMLGTATADSDTTKFIKDVVAHETAHQWWGSLVTNANDRNYWFVESLAEFSSAIFVENVYGPKKYHEKIEQWRRTILETDLLQPVQAGYTLFGGETAPRTPYPPQAAIYNKGPYAFHILRVTLGDDKLFFKGMAAMAQSLKGKEVTTTDLQVAAEQAIQKPLGWFFDQWLRGVGMPQYSVSYTKRKTEDGSWLVEGKIRQRVLLGKDMVEMPGVYFDTLGRISIKTFKGQIIRANPRPVRGAETAFSYKFPEEPADVFFNKDGEILAYDVLYNRSW